MIHLEDKLQIECVRYFNLQYPDIMIIHIRNGGSLKSDIRKISKPIRKKRLLN